MNPLARDNLGFWAAVLVAFAVRALWIGEQCLHMDEVTKLAMAKMPVAEVFVLPDSLPPGYPLLLKGWLFLTHTDHAARWLSLLAGVAGVMATYSAATELVGRRAAAAAAMVMAVLPLHVYYSQLARVYSLFFLAAVVALWLLLRALRKGDRWSWGGYALVGVLGMWLHYYFVIVLVLGAVVVLWKRRGWRVGVPALVSHIAIGAGVAPLLFLLPSDLSLQQEATRPRPLTLAAFAYTYFTFLSGGSLGPSVPELHTLSAGQAAAEAAPWAAVIAVAGLPIALPAVSTAKKSGSLGLLLLLLIAPPLLIGAIGHALDLTYHFRFVLWCMVPMAVLLGAGLAEGGGSLAVRVGATALGVVCLVALYNRQHTPRYENEDLQAAAQQLVDAAGAGEPIFVLSDYLADVLRYYLPSGYKVFELPSPGGVRQSVQGISDAEQASGVVSQAASEGDYWLVYSRAFHGDPQEILLEHLKQRDDLALDGQFPGVMLFRSHRHSTSSPPAPPLATTSHQQGAGQPAAALPKPGLSKPL